MELTALDYTALAATLVAFVVIWALNRRKVNFSAVVILALLIGAGLGLIFEGATQLIEPFGSVYVRLLLAIVVPLIFVSVLSSVTSLGSISQLRSIGGRSVAWLLGFNLIAIILTLVVAIPVGIGNNANLSTQTVDAGELAELEGREKPFTEVLIEFFPKNIFDAAATNQVIPIIIASLAIAVAIALIGEKNPEKVSWATQGIETARVIVYKVVGFVIALTPYAVLSLTAAAVSNLAGDLSALTPLIKLLIVSYALCLGYTYLILSGVLVGAYRLNPVTFVRKFFPAQATAFTTQSSAGTLPLSTALQTRRLGVPVDVAGFTTPLGTTIGMPGCAGVWPMLLAVYAINGYGLDYGVGDYIRLVLIGLLVSIGTAGVPGTATIVALTVLTAAGLPIEVVILTLPISAVVDMVRTLTNVSTAAVASVLVANGTGELNRDVYRTFDPSQDEAAAWRNYDVHSAALAESAEPVEHDEQLVTASTAAR